MAFVLTTPGEPLNAAGPDDAVDLAESFGKLFYNINMGESCTDIIGDATDIIESGTGIITSVLWKKFENITMCNAIMCLIPKNLPPVWFPYMVRQCNGSLVMDECLSCNKPQYYLVLFNSHTGEFKVDQYFTKDEMKRIYNIKNQEVIDADEIFKLTNEKAKSQLLHNIVELHRVPQGIFRNNRIVEIQDKFITYGQFKSLGKIGAFSQTFVGNNVKSLDNKTGSWEKLLKVANIKHKVGYEKCHIGSSIADFIGLWICATGDVSSITKASYGTININAEFSSNWNILPACMCAPVGSPSTHSRIKYRWDTLGTWI